MKSKKGNKQSATHNASQLLFMTHSSDMVRASSNEEMKYIMIPSCRYYIIFPRIVNIY